MKLTPLDIHHKEFRRALRGYSEEEVDVFLDQVADEFERLFKENIDLKEQVEKMQAKVDQYAGVENSLQKALLTAQQAADELQNSAQKESELIVRDAELKAKEIIQNIIQEKQQLESELQLLRDAEKGFRAKFKELLASYMQVIDEIQRGERPAPAAQVSDAEAAALVDEPALDQPVLEQPEQAAAEPDFPAFEPAAMAAPRPAADESPAPTEQPAADESPLFAEQPAVDDAPLFGEEPAADAPAPEPSPESAMFSGSEPEPQPAQEFRVTLADPVLEEVPAESGFLTDGPSVDESSRFTRPPVEEEQPPVAPQPLDGAMADKVSTFFDDDLGDEPAPESKPEDEPA